MLFHVQKKKIKWSDFVRKYGHLRPGTYDITSPSYIKDPQSYLKPVIDRAKLIKNSNDHRGNSWENTKDKFFEELNSVGILGTQKELEGFMKSAIEGREYAKFAFTRNLSLALDSIEAWGKTNDLDVEMLSHVSIEDLRMIKTGAIGVHQLVDRAKSNKEATMNSKFIELPPLITNKNDFSIFLYPKTNPNFIGNESVMTACINLEGTNATEESVEGKIVLIPQADPGYDWLFGRSIAGLITMYGGANSHMAIRAAEFGLPAAIGIGENLYHNISSKSRLELNPEKKDYKSYNIMTIGITQRVEFNEDYDEVRDSLDQQWINLLCKAGIDFILLPNSIDNLESWLEKESQWLHLNWWQ